MIVGKCFFLENINVIICIFFKKMLNYYIKKKNTLENLFKASLAPK